MQRQCLVSSPHSSHLAVTSRAQPALILWDVCQPHRWVHTVLMEAAVAAAVTHDDVIVLGREGQAGGEAGREGVRWSLRGRVKGMGVGRHERVWRVD